VRVVVADDSVLVREGIRGVLSDAGLECVALVPDAVELMSAVERERPEVAVVDIRMPPAHSDEGIVAAAEIRERFPEVGVLVLSQYVDAGYALRLLEGKDGRCGYLLKDRLVVSGELVDAVRRVDAGELVVDRELVEALLGRRRANGPLESLTAREREVLQLMAEGYTDRGIAERLWLTRRTVETHVRHILRKLEIPVGEAYNPRVRAVLAYLDA
jgi:DNA-binding NarL/FixJ family response regulator